ncbi:MAG: alpha/beta hydrolase, partial [Kribbellaceae bacterium]|nr:alpha/beta hydrolase [Kribbellaceae bacterium]
MILPRMILAGAVLLGAAGLPAASATTERLHWTDCDGDPAVVKGSECATLQLPVDWRNPGGPTFGLALARRKAEVP